MKPSSPIFLLFDLNACLSLMVFAGQQIVRNLRESLFSSILRQEVGFFDKTRTGELINRLSSDTALVGSALTDNMSDGLRSVAQAVAGVSMMVSSSLKRTNAVTGIKSLKDVA